MTKVRDLTAAQFARQGDRLPPGAQLCEILDDEGSTCHGYELGGQLVKLVVVTRSPAAQVPFDAIHAAAATVETKRAAALAIVRSQVTRVKAIAAGSRTDADKWLLALSFLALTEE